MGRMIENWLDRIHVGNCVDLLRQLPDGVANLVITSPPYFQQRQYTASDEEIGRESEVDEYIGSLYRVFEECVRVTREDGSIVFNIGDKYVDGDLLLIPYQFALHVKRHARHVKLINDVTWVKSNPTPRQFDRRMVSATEPFFHFVKGPRYKYCMECVAGVAAETKPNPSSRTGNGYFKQIDESGLTDEQKVLARKELSEVIDEVRAGKLAGLRMKIMGCHSMPFGGQEGGRLTQLLTKGFTIIRLHGRTMLKDWTECPVETIKGINHPAIYPRKLVEVFVRLTTQESDVVIDPFVGSGTTGVVCRTLGRRFVGMELCDEFAEDARRRIWGSEGSPEMSHIGRFQDS